MRAPHTATTLGSAAPARDGPAQQVARFGLHVAEMCAVMCVTLILTGLAVTAAAAALGTPTPSPAHRPRPQRSPRSPWLPP